MQESSFLRSVSISDWFWIACGKGLYLSIAYFSTPTEYIMIIARNIRSTKNKATIPAFEGTHSLHLLQTSKVIMVPIIEDLSDLH